VLETAIIGLACEQAATLDFSTAEASLRLQQFYIENQMPDKLLELDDDFHRELFRLTNRMQTYLLLESMRLHFDRVRSLSLATVKEIKIVADHEAILRAIRAGDKAEAAAQVARHLSRYKVDEQAIRERFANYFTPRQC
jgi:DNA-binding GntR family transcriptional regulator